MNIGTNPTVRRSSSPAVGRTKLIALASFALCLWGSVRVAWGTDAPVQSHSPSAAFEGAKTAWHGFDRYDYFMDEQTLAIKPADGKVRGGVKGQRRCIVVVPKSPAPGNPWSWRGCYWDHQPQAEVELLRRGFHIAYITADASLRPDKKWDAWYAFLTEMHGLSTKPAFIGMSRGGEFEYTWATSHPDKVGCIYADNPGVNPGVFAKLADLAANDVPVLQICGSLDPSLDTQTRVAEKRYKELGGKITVIVKEGEGHYPLAPKDPKAVVDFITTSAR